MARRIAHSIFIALFSVSALSALSAAAQTPPVVRAGRAVIGGTIPAAAVARVLARHLREVSACADTHGAHDVVLHLVLGPTGTVRTATVEGDRAFGDCVVAVARNWTFPGSGADTTIDVPLGFTAR